MRKHSIDRSKLPEPFKYYSRYFKLPKQSGNTLVHCCFHNDRTPSLSINLDQGWFKCFGCGAKGGDVLAFHKKKNQMGFIQACRDLNLEFY